MAHLCFVCGSSGQQSVYLSTEVCTRWRVLSFLPFSSPLGWPLSRADLCCCPLAIAVVQDAFVHLLSPCCMVASTRGSKTSNRNEIHSNGMCGRLSERDKVFLLPFSFLSRCSYASFPGCYISHVKFNSL